MKTTQIATLVALLATPTTFAASYQIDVHIASAPNKFGNRPDFNTFAGYARQAMMQGVTEVGPDPNIDPTGYREFASGQTVDASYAIATTIPSWHGKINPTGALEGQHGNRLTYSLHLQTTGGAKFNLADISWTNVATINGEYLSDDSHTSGLLTKYTTTYDGLVAYGIDWGADGIKGTSDDIIYNNGKAGDTLVNELYFVGLGRAWDENERSPDGLTGQEKIDYTRNYLNGVINTATFTIGGETGSGYVKFSAVPEPSSAALLGLGGLALILRRRK